MSQQLIIFVKIIAACYHIFAATQHFLTYFCIILDLKDIPLAPNMGACYKHIMRIIARKILRDFWESPAYADSEQPLKSWFKTAKEADWAEPSEVKEQFRNASFIGSNRVIFNIAGNKYRLVVAVNYPYRVLYIRFIGTHAQYDKIKVKEI